MNLLARILALSLLAAPLAQAEVVLSNLGESSVGASPAALNFWFGSRFLTDASSPLFTLESVSLSMADATNSSGNFFASIYSDAGGVPGTALGTLSGSASPATAGVHVYTASGLTLEGGTSYWIVAGVTSGDGNYSWNVTDSNAFTGSWSIPATATHIYSFDQGAVWQPATDGFPRQFSISASAVPEPSTVALILLGLAAAGVVRARRLSR